MAVEAASTPAEHAPAAEPMKRQRILMTADTLGEVWHYALELSRALTARGHDVVLATMGAMPSRDQRREAGEVPDLALYSSAYKLLWMDDPWNDVGNAGAWLMNLASRLRPSVLHLNDFGHATLPWSMPVLSVGHACVLSWWRAVHGAPPPQGWLRYRQAVLADLNAADLVVTPTRAMLQALEHHYGVRRACRVIPHASHDGVQDSTAKGPWIFSVGSLDDAGKNIEALAAIARLPWPVYVAESAPRAEPSPRADDNVRMLGHLGCAQVRRWLAHAPIFALPARYEPFGMSVLEAALARCALVLGDIDSLREVWDGAAIFVAPDDHAALAHALRRLIADTALRERYAALARERAEAHRPAAMADAYLRAYADIGAEDCRAGGATASIHALSALQARRTPALLRAVRR